VSVTWRKDPSGYLVYEDSRTGRKMRISTDTLDEIADICKDWHGGKQSPSYRLMSGGWSYENLKAALGELRWTLHEVDEDAESGDSNVDEDDHIDLATAVEDLEGIVSRIAQVRS
jgi:hypothetical protein